MVGNASAHLGASGYQSQAHQKAKEAQGEALVGWRFDFIIPLDSFDLSDPAEVERAIHWSNLEPVWVSGGLDPLPFDEVLAIEMQILYQKLAQARAVQLHTHN